MIKTFLNQRESLSLTTEDPLKIISNMITSKPAPFDCETLSDIISGTESVVAKNYEDFKTFIQKVAVEDETWKFWIQFVFQDVAAYVGLFLAIRSGDWDLRTACIKQMASVFTAFDHANYCKLISQHLADLLCMPQSILTIFLSRCIFGRTWHTCEQLNENTKQPAN